MPRLSAGSHTVTVKDGADPANTATETFTVVDTPVVETPEEVFGELGDKLVSVWSLDNTTKAWSAYFPGAPEGVSDLTGVAAATSSGSMSTQTLPSRAGCSPPAGT